VSITNKNKALILGISGLEAINKTGESLDSKVFDSRLINSCLPWRSGCCIFAKSVRSALSVSSLFPDSCRCSIREREARGRCEESASLAKRVKISAAHLPEEYSKTDRLYCDPSRCYAHKNFPASSAAYGGKTDMATHVAVAQPPTPNPNHIESLGAAPFSNSAVSASQS
jgi:hypothetical protein